MRLKRHREDVKYLKAFDYPNGIWQRYLNLIRMAEDNLRLENPYWRTSVKRVLKDAE